MKLLLKNCSSSLIDYKKWFLCFQFIATNRGNRVRTVFRRRFIFFALMLIAVNVTAHSSVSPESDPIFEFSPDRLTSLEGPWRVETGDNAAWADPGHDDSRWNTIRVPGNIMSLYPGYDGIAWYRIRVRFHGSPHEPVMVMLGKINDVDETYFNGIKIGATGDIGDPKSHAFDRQRVYVVPGELIREGNNVIAVRTRGYLADSGGLVWGKYAVGPARLVQRKVVAGLIIDLFLAGMYIFIGLYFSIFSLMSKYLRSQHVVFAVTAVSIAAYLLCMGPVKYYFFDTLYPFHLAQYLAGMTGCGSLLLLMRLTFRETIRRTDYACWAFLAIIGVSLPLIGEIRDWTIPRIAWHLCIVYVAASITASIIRSLRRRQWGYLYVDIGYLVLVAGVLLEILRVFSLMPDMEYVQYALGGMILSLTFFFAEQNRTMQEFEKRLRERLELELVEKTRDVMERTEELRSANEKLQELHSIKNDFIANISHELRTPLTLILLPVESVIRADGTQKIDRDFFVRLHASGEKLLRLINNLLDFSKIEAGRMSVSRKPADLAEFVATVCAGFHSAAASKGIGLECRCGEDRPVARIDRNLFETALFNLLSNAIKFTPAGGRITVTLARRGEAAEIAVTDTGIGIPGNRLEAIFERFYQVDSSSTRKHGGTGIGLSLAKEIMDLHGGSISVTSREGEGSAFVLSIPCAAPEDVIEPEMLTHRPDAVADDNPVHDSAPIARETPDTPGPVDGCPPGEQSGTILVVEDNADMRGLLCSILEGRYRVFTAINGREAMDFLGAADEVPDLVLADVMMPEMDGYELAERIRGDGRYEGMPVILVTARSEPQMKAEGLERGATDYIAKPFNARELLARIYAQLEMKRLRDRLARSNRALYRRLEEKLKASVGADAEEKVMEARAFIDENFSSDLSREGLAAAVGMHPDHLSRAFNRVMGKKIAEYLHDLRVEKAKNLLTHTSDTVMRIAMECGFEDVRTFNRVFREIAGTTPSEYRKTAK